MDPYPLLFTERSIYSDSISPYTNIQVVIMAIFLETVHARSRYIS